MAKELKPTRSPRPKPSKKLSTPKKKSQEESIVHDPEEKPQEEVQAAPDVRDDRSYVPPAPEPPKQEETAK